MLKPIFLDNGLTYDEYGIETCILIPEEHIEPMLNHFEKIHSDNYKTMLKDKPEGIKFINITESLIYEYLKAHNIEYYVYNTSDTLIMMS